MQSSNFFSRITVGVIVAIVGGLLSLAAVANDYSEKKEDAKQYAQDSLITTKVVSKLAAESNLTSKDIITNTYKNGVQLCGFTKNETEEKLAVRTAQTVDDVKTVYDDLTPISSFADSRNASYANDTAITTKVKSSLLTNKQIPVNQISVITQQGHVQLCGFVDNNDIKQKAERLAKDVNGVKDVKNTLRVK